jgi:hypothetical protein
LNTFGVVYVTPSTITWRPTGTLVTVYPNSFVNSAVNTFGAFISSVAIATPGTAPTIGITDAPVQSVNWYPALAVAVNAVVVAPGFHQLTPAGVTLPPTAGFATAVKLYCFPNVAVYVAGVCGVITVWL